VRSLFELLGCDELAELVTTAGVWGMGVAVTSDFEFGPASGEGYFD